MSILKTIYLQHLNGSSPNATLDANGNMTVTGTVAGASSNMFRNRIHNGAMVIDQRNAGGSVTASTTSYPWPYTVDRWNYTASQASKFTVQQNAGSITPPAGFSYYLGITSSSSYTVGISENFCIQQRIEGYNMADLAWGTANAKTVTVSFWVRSSLTGTFGFCFDNALDNRTYIAPYTINSANTWEYKTITIPGDTSGTWNNTNGTGVCVTFSLGTGTNYLTSSGIWNSGLYLGATGQVNLVGTSGATFYITGVQLEVGTKATPFEFRQYGQELALCQRYYEKSYNQADVPGTVTDLGVELQRPSSTECNFNIKFKVPKRTNATFTSYSPATGASAKMRQVDGTGSPADISISAGNNSENGIRVYGVVGASVAYTYMHWTASAEL